MSEGVERFVPLGDGLAAETEGEVERGQTEHRDGEHDVVPVEEPRRSLHDSIWRAIQASRSVRRKRHSSPYRTAGRTHVTAARRSAASARSR